MNGLARGLLSIVCISAPAMDRAAPTSTAIRAMGILMSHTITLVVSSAEPGMKIVETTSQRPRRAGPRDMSKTSVQQSTTASVAMSRYLRPVICR